MHVIRSFLDTTRILSSTDPSFFLALLTVYNIIPRVSSAPSPELGVAFHDLTAYNHYNELRVFKVRLAAAICATASMMAAFVSFYWFFRMKKRFRHRLIMLLIYGDMMKAGWLMILAVVSIARGTVKSTSPLCQASGFLVQYGTETSDYAVLMIAAHSALQVFRPSMSREADGLYPYRHLVLAGALFFPITMSALVFVNPKRGYMSQGAFCLLPLRPFWYRLALAWIPRYLIAIIILGLAVAIYTHVGFVFRNSTSLERKSTFSNTQSIASTIDLEGDILSDIQPSEHDEPQTVPERRASSVGHDILVSRRASIVPSSLICMMDTHQEMPENHGRCQSLPSSPHSEVLVSPLTSRNDFATSNVTFHSLPPSAIHDSRPDNETRKTSLLSSAQQSQAQKHMMHQRSRVHRQLRLLFIYPLIYILMWLGPFINHCMQYRNHWAVTPLYWVSFISATSFTLMGLVDCIVFTIRERPWRHIPNSDGTFLGSFTPWRSRSNNKGSVSTTRPSDVSELSRSMSEPRASNRNSLTDGSGLAGMPNLSIDIPKVKEGSRTSRSSDQQIAAMELARLRLEYEKEDRRIAKLDEKSRRAREQDKRREDDMHGGGISEESLKEGGSSNGKEEVSP